MNHQDLHSSPTRRSSDLYKSTDAGKTWTHLGLRNSQGIPALAVDPRNPNRVFAAALGHPYGASEERGIYLSTDGGENRSEEHTSELQSRLHLVCRLLHEI